MVMYSRLRKIHAMLGLLMAIAGLPTRVVAAVGVYQKELKIENTTEQILTDMSAIEQAIGSISAIEGAASTLELLLQQFEQLANNLSSIESIASLVEQISPQLSSIDITVNSIDSKVDLLATETTSLLIESKIDALNMAANTTQSKVFVMNTELLGVDSKIDELAGDIADAQSTANSINSKVDILQLDALATLTTINTTQSKIFVMNNELVGVDSKIDELAGDIADVQSTANSINSKVDILQLDALATLTTINTTQSKIFVMNTELVGVDSKIDALQQTVDTTESLVERIESLIAEPVVQNTGALQINMPGTYSLTSDFAGQININSSDVNLDLNGYRVFGGTNGIVVNGVNQVVIYNGAIQSAASAGIAINAGSSAVTIKDLTISNCSTGVMTTSSNTIYLDHVNTISCANGFSYQSAQNVIADDCSASEMTARGFDLDGCSVVNHRRCKAMNLSGTGIVAGFYSTNGNTNLFDQCYAEGISTSATNTTMYAAGFVLSDTASTIISNSIADSIAAPNATAYGINAGTLSSELLATTSYITSIVEVFNAVATNTVNDFVAAVGTNTTIPAAIINIYDISTDQFVLTSSASTSTVFDESRAVVWSPDGNYVAMVAQGVGQSTLNIYTVNGSGILGLSPVITTTTIRLESISWSPTGSYLAVGANDISHVPNDGVILLYHFDGSSLTLLDVVYPSSDNIISLSWFYNTQYLIAGGGDSLAVYELVSNSLQLTSETVVGTGFVSSSPDANQFAASLFLAASSFATLLTELHLTRGVPFDNNGLPLPIVVNASLSGGKNNAPDVLVDNPGGLRWSKDGKNVVIGGTLINLLTVGSSFFEVYAEGGNFSLTLRTTVPSVFVAGVEWNSTNNRIIVCGAAGTAGVTFMGGALWLYSFDQSALAANCAIDSNMISNVQGGIDGIGIAGISTMNSIINNKSYNCATNFGLGVDNINVGFATQPWQLANISL